MAKGIYIASVERSSGKSLLLLGLMELLSQRVKRLGCFRPVIRDHGGIDNDIELVRRQYSLPQSFESSYAATYDQARDLVAAGKQAALLEQILDRFSALQRQCDFVVCEGTDYTGVSSAFEFEFNAHIANHLGCPVIIVLNGQNKSPHQIADIIASTKAAFLAEGCTVVATVVNRTPPDIPDARGATPPNWPEGDLLYFIPEVPTLSSPTIGEIATALEAETIYDAGESLNRDAQSIKIAAMELPNFLGHVEDGSLIIVPSDRSDIVLGCLATTLSQSYPKISGIVLTGGLPLAPQIRRMIDGIQRPTVPILSVDCDTYTAATQIHDVRAAILPNNQRKIAAALGAFEAHVDMAELAARIEVARSTSITPLMFEHELVERAKTSRQHIVLPEGQEERILRAAEIVLRRGVADITLLGDQEQIRTKMSSLAIDVGTVNIVNPATSPWREDFAETYFQLRQHKGITAEVAADTMLDASYFGTMMVYNDLADGMVSGSVHTTAHTIRPAFEIIKTRPGCDIVSSVMFMCLADRVLVYGDCAINPNPDAQQLADIAISSADTAQMFGIEPRVAMLSYSTGLSGKGADVDTVREATLLARKLRPDLKLEGPIQYDAAIDASVARTKMPDSDVAGRATVFVFPDLNTGNNTYKAVQRSANAVAIGPVLQGLKKPVNDLSRGCTVTDIVNTVAITAVQSIAMKKSAESSS